MIADKNQLGYVDTNLSSEPHREEQVLETPFHEGVARACKTNHWFDWKGYTTPHSFTEVEFEYFAIRSSAALFDLTPMTKYKIEGPDATDYLNRLVTRNMSKVGVGRVAYAVWCNDDGQVMDDGTLFHLQENVWRLCSQERCLDWMRWSAVGFDVEITDETAEVAALSLQGPTSCSILRAMGLEGIENLKPFGITYFPFEGAELVVSRTGFTGDLGYELWTSNDKAMPLWNQLMAAGKDYMIHPMGADALDIARIEAGFVQAGVDFMPAEVVIRPGRTRSPYELGLGWLVDLSKPVFNGRKALIKEQAEGSRFRFAKLDIDGNKPANNSFIFNKNGDKVGTVTSAAWCPTAKSNVAFACLDMPWGKDSDALFAEIYYQRELEWTRVLAPCRVSDKPTFNPARRRITPAGNS